MKKWMIGALVALMGLMLGLQWLNKKNEASRSVAAPAADTSSETAQEPQPAAPMTGAVASSASDMIVSTVEDSVCKTGSTDEILKAVLASNGRTWGYTVKDFDPTESHAITNELTEHFSCKAAATRDIGVCDVLPTDAEPLGKRSPAMVPKNRCADIVNHLLFLAYMAGKNNDMAACIRSLKALNSSPVSDDPAKYCPTFAQGPEKFCPKLPDEKLCRSAYPIQKGDCRDQGCLDNFSDYTAIKTGNVELCSNAHRALCEVVITKSLDSCAKPAKLAAKMYCAAVSGQKNKEEAAKAEAKRIETEKLQVEAKKMQMVNEKRGKELAAERKEQEKTLQDVNKDIRKMMGRE